MQPVTISRSSPLPLRSATSRIVSIDSCFAASMKPQVLTMTTSASSRSFVISTSDSCAQLPEHDLGVDEILRAAEGDHADAAEGLFGRDYGH